MFTLTDKIHSDARWTGDDEHAVLWDDRTGRVYGEIGHDGHGKYGGYCWLSWWRFILLKYFDDAPIFFINFGPRIYTGVFDSRSPEEAARLMKSLCFKRLLGLRW